MKAEFQGEKMNSILRKQLKKVKVHIKNLYETIENFESKDYELIRCTQRGPDHVEVLFSKIICEESEYSEQDIMIRATRWNNVKKQDLLDTFAEKGLIGVYNLGLKNMYVYLSNPQKE